MPRKAFRAKLKPRHAVTEGASFPISVGKQALPDDYAAVLHGLKERIRSECLRVTLSASAAMVLFTYRKNKDSEKPGT